MTAIEPTSAAQTRRALHRVAVHVVARSRQQATGRFSLRVTAGGFGTPEFGDDGRRVRVSGGALVVESDASDAPSAIAHDIAGASLRRLAEFAGADLDVDLDVGHDTPGLGDVDAEIAIDAAEARALLAWYGAVADALDRVLVVVTPDRSASLPRLWPEHFDVAIEVDARPGRRVNLGGSPGDGFCPEPYVYVGPWTSDRPGDGAFWNAPFGAYVPASSLGADQVVAAAAFLLSGVERLAAGDTG
jgi:hypothetical protein